MVGISSGGSSNSRSDRVESLVPAKKVEDEATISLLAVGSRPEVLSEEDPIFFILEQPVRPKTRLRKMVSSIFPNPSIGVDV